MATLRGLRRRGYTPEIIADFLNRVGIAKANSVVDIALLEHCIREDLNERAPRAMAVLEPLKVVITNYPEGQVEYFDVPNHPQKPEMGTRQVPFSRVVYIEQEDFMETPAPKYFRLAPGREVRLVGAYYITCTDVVKDADGTIVELHATYDPESRGGATPDGRKVKGTIHWVSAAHALDAEMRMYDYLFTKDDPGDAPEGQDFMTNLNPDSIVILTDAKVEPGLAGTQTGDLQSCAKATSAPTRIRRKKIVFNLTVSLRIAGEGATTVVFDRKAKMTLKSTRKRKNWLIVPKIWLSG